MSAEAPAPPPALSGRQRRHLRALGHHLRPVVQIGREGITAAVVAEARLQLAAHELIKVKISEAAPDDRHAAADQLCRETSAVLAQVLGRTLLLYLRRAEDPQIALPP